MKASIKLEKGGKKVQIKLSGKQIIEILDFPYEIDAIQYYKRRKMSLKILGYLPPKKKEAPKLPEKKRKKYVTLFGKRVEIKEEIEEE